MGFLRKLLFFWKKEERTEEIPEQEERKSFFLYVIRTPEIVTYFRRERGISRKNLELVIVDNEDRPAWEVQQIVELLISDLNLLYLVTEREEAFSELMETAFGEHGLLIVLLSEIPEHDPPGNLVLDLNDWEKHLDIISTVGYNTLIQ